jgi:hypothetical protein
MWIAILCLWTWTALPDEGGNTMRSGLVGRAGAVELLEFEKQHVVRELRIVKVTDAGTNVVATTTVTGDYGKGVKIGIVQLHKGAAAGKFLITLAVSNHSTSLETEYVFSLDSRENPKEYYAPRVLSLSSSNWAQVYGFKESFPRSELRVELLGSERSTEPDGAANGSQPFRPETNRTSGAAGSRR